MKAVKIVLPLVALLAVTLFTSTVEAQRGRGGGFWGRNGDSLLNLLMNEKVQEELDFVDDQADQVEELQNEFREEMRYMFEDMRDGGGDRQEMFEKMREKMTELNEEFNSKAEELLIDDQLKRLKQLQNQSRMRGGIERALENESFRDELGITDEQMEELREKAEEVRDWAAKEYERVREEAQDKVLSVLSKEQRDKIKEMTGDSFDFGQQRGFFNRGNGRGNGQGNNRGGGGRRGGTDF